MAKKTPGPYDLCCDVVEPPRLNTQFKSGASLSEGLSGRAPLDTEPKNYKADRAICASKPRSEK